MKLKFLETYRSNHKRQLESLGWCYIGSQEHGGGYIHIFEKNGLRLPALKALKEEGIKWNSPVSLS